MAQIPEVEIFGKEGCCLCDDALDVLMKVQEKIPFTLVRTDISCDEQLMEKYQHLIPVICINGQKKFIFAVQEEELVSALTSAD